MRFYKKRYRRLHFKQVGVNTHWTTTMGTADNNINGINMTSQAVLTHPHWVTAGGIKYQSQLALLQVMMRRLSIQSPSRHPSCYSMAWVLPQQLWPRLWEGWLLLCTSISSSSSAGSLLSEGRCSLSGHDPPHLIPKEDQEKQFWLWTSVNLDHIISSKFIPVHMFNWQFYGQTLCFSFHPPFSFYRGKEHIIFFFLPFSHLCVRTARQGCWAIRAESKLAILHLCREKQPFILASAIRAYSRLGRLDSRSRHVRAGSL